MNRSLIVSAIVAIVGLTGCSSTASMHTEVGQDRAQLKPATETLAVGEAPSSDKGRHGRSAMARERILK